MEEADLESRLKALRNAGFPGTASRRHELVPGEVRAWVCAGPLPAGLAGEAMRYLTPFDHDALARVSNVQAREERTQARALLRALLALHRGPEAASLPFDEREHGKPFLRGGPEGLEFSVSHSRGAIAVALAIGMEVGVDVEVPKPMPGRVERLAPRVLDPASLAWFESLPQADSAARDSFFYRQWVVREAVLKALGSGLTIDPRGLVVSPPGSVTGSVTVALRDETFTCTITEVGGIPVAIASRGGWYAIFAI